MDNDYPTVEQATAAPGEWRAVATARRCWVSATLTRNKRQVSTTRLVYCDLELGHAGDHHFTV